MKVTNDRRKMPRVRLSGAAVIYDGRAPMPCDGVDLSIGGVGLRSPTKIKKGRNVQVVLPIGEYSLTLAAQVRRCRAEAGGFRIGLRFAGLDPATAQALEAFVQTASQRDVRMYQAQVFLARTGAAELDKVFAQAAADTRPSAPPAESITTTQEAQEEPPAAAASGPRPVTGQTAIVVDESAPTGPNKVVDPKERPRTAAWTPTRPQGHENVDSPELRTAVVAALSDLEDELGEPEDDEVGRGHTMMLDPPAAADGTPLPRPPTSGPPPSFPPPPSPASALSFSADLSSLDYGATSISNPMAAAGSGTVVMDQRELAARSRGVRPPPPLKVERPDVPSPPPASRHFAPSLGNLDFEDEGPTQLFAGDEEYEYVYESPAAPPRPAPVSAPSRAPHDEAAPIHHPPSPFGAMDPRPTIPGRSDQTQAEGPPMRTQIAIQAPNIPSPQPVARITQFAVPQAPPPQAPPRYNPDATQVAIPTDGVTYGPVRGEATQIAIPAAGLPSAPVASPPPQPLPGTGQHPPSPFSRPAPPPPPSPPRAAARPADDARPPGHRFAPSQQATMGPGDDLQTRMRDELEVDDTEDRDFAAKYERALTDLDLESR